MSSKPTQESALGSDLGSGFAGRLAAAVAGSAILVGALVGADRASLPAPAWQVMVCLAALLLVLVVVRPPGQTDGSTKPIRLDGHGRAMACTALRWVVLLLAVASAAHFGKGASLPADRPNILRLELAGSPEAARSVCADCAHPLEESIGQDWWFIAAYVVLLVLLALWAGSYFRIEAARGARLTVAAVVAAAGAFDLLENWMLLIGAHQWDSEDAWAVVWQIAAVAAWVKLTLLLLAVLYVLGGAFSWLVTPGWVRRASWLVPVTHTPHTERPRTLLAATAQDAQRPLGIALSGGGIRAASISLGALQVLERQADHDPKGGLGWDAARAVTAVSGGSNMAAAWSISRSSYGTSSGGMPSRVQPDALRPRPWARQVDGAVTPEERRLVDNLGYLASNNPRGDGTDPAAPKKLRTNPKPGGSYRPTAYATIFAGFVANTTVLLAALWVLTRPVGWGLRALEGGDVEEGDFHRLVAEHSLPVPGVSMLTIGLLLLVTWVLLGQWLVKNADTKVWRRGTLQALQAAAYGALGLGVGLILVLWAFPELVGWVAGISRGRTSLTAVVGAAGVLGSVVRILRKPAARFAPMIGGLVFLVLLLFLAAAWTWGAARSEPSWDLLDWNSRANWLAAFGLLVSIQFLVSPERWSLAAFYRGKLRLAYATYRAPRGKEDQSLRTYLNDNASPDRQHREPGLHEFGRRGTQDARDTTPLVICATSTISSRAVRTHYGIPALSVTFDPEHVTLRVPHEQRGGWVEYAAPTRLVNQLGRSKGKRVTTMLAAAISSAAVSPAMGRIRIGPTSMLLTFANIRLGLWMPNPRYLTLLEGSGAGAERASYPRTGLGYLLKEFFGVHDLTDPFLYMTDGGHWENTGLVEMLRRPDVSEVICVDADSGPGDATSSAGKAIDLAPLECDVRVYLNLDPLRAKLAGTRAPDYAQRTVNLGFFLVGSAAFQPGDPVGVLWYSKPGLTQDMPESLLAFRETHADYPRVSTMNQFFDVSTFAAYRDLGRYNAEVILRARAALLEVLGVVLADGASADVRLAELAADPGRHWVVDELATAVRSLGSQRTRDFCSSVQLSLGPA